MSDATLVRSIEANRSSQSAYSLVILTPRASISGSGAFGAFFLGLAIVCISPCLRSGRRTLPIVCATGHCKFSHYVREKQVASQHGVDFSMYVAYTLSVGPMSGPVTEETQRWRRWTNARPGGGRCWS